MAYSERLAERIRARIGDNPNYRERKMFGGLAFMLNGHLACGVMAHELMVQIGPDRYEQILTLPYAREMTFSGRPLTGMVLVSSDGFESDAKLAAWLELGANYVRNLPAKTEP